MAAILYIIVPCYNEEAVLPITAPMFLTKINELAAVGKISPESRVMFVNDGSRDRTWEIISELAKGDEHYIGISQSRNRGHQNAVLAGLMEAREHCDITISIDCDGQDDINAMDAMVDAYLDGCEVVYGVRSSRETDTFFKRFTAQSFYKFLSAMGAEVVYNHADYRLISARVLKEFANFREVKLFPRGAHRGREPLSAEKNDRSRGRRHHEPVGEAAADDNRLRRSRRAHQLHRRAVGTHHGDSGQGRRGLGEHDVHNLLCQRRTAYLPRHHRRVHRENIS